MSQPFKVACIQNTAIDDIAFNLADTTELVESACADGANLICLPEYFACLEAHDSRYLENGLSEDEHPVLAHFSRLAAQLEAYLLLGSLAIKVSDDKVCNRSYLMDANGQIVQTYDKIHLFDVSLKRGESYKESNTVEAGTTARLASLPWGRLGMSICYDVRFPQLYRSLAHAGAQFLSVPAAFTATTGAAHWHVLLRARAIETGCFVFAPGQCGKRPWGRRTYGHSLIINPWGEILADAGDERGYVIADIDVQQVAEARAMIPALAHDRTFAEAPGEART